MTYIVVFVFAAVFIGFLAYMRLVALPVAKKYSADRIRARTVIAINSAVASTLAADRSTADVVKITFDSESAVTAVSVDTVALNEVVRNIIGSVQAALDEIRGDGVVVPLGTLLGVTFLSGLGPEVTLRVLPVGITEAEIATGFTEVGINQTRHTIALKLSTDVDLFLAGASGAITTTTEVPVCENLIVGKIPSTYLKATTFQDMMDLVA